MGQKLSWVGLGRPQDTVGITGLVPFEILEMSPQRLRPGPGVVRVWLDLSPDENLVLDRPIQYRVWGWEAGFLFEKDGRIVRRDLGGQPLELPYQMRSYPEPPDAGQIALDLAFSSRKQAGRPSIQDVQWRQPIHWDRQGTHVLELRFARKGFISGSGSDT